MNKMLLIGLALLLLLPIGVFAGDLDYFYHGYKFDNTNDVNGTENINGFSNTPFVTGKIGNAMLTSAPAVRSENSIAWSGGGSLTSVGWFRLNGTLASGNNATIFEKTTGSWVRLNRIAIQNVSGTYRVYYQHAGNATLISYYGNASTLYNVWVNVAVVFNHSNNNATLYINGQPVNSSFVTNGTGGALSGGTAFGNDRSSTTTPFTGLIDSWYFWNYPLSANAICLMNNATNGAENPMSGLSCSTDVIANASITIYDFYTNASISNFSVFENNTLIASTTNGTANLPYRTNTSSLYNLVINSTQNGGYFNLSRQSQNVSGVMNFPMSQSVVVFAATQKISGSLLSGVTFNTSLLTNGTQYLPAGSRNVTATKTGYFTRSQEINVVALSSSTKIVENMSNAQLNLTAKNNITNANIPSFTATIVALNYSNLTFNESVSSGSQIYLIDGNYQIRATAAGYAPAEKNLTILGGLYVTNSTIEMYAENSIYFSVFNASSLALLNNVTTTIQILGTSTSINTTTNGTLFVSGLSIGSYDITISAPGFENSQYVVTIGNNSFQYLNAYLESTTLNSVVFTAKDDDTSQTIQDVITTIEKRVNGTYYVVSSLYTDITGRIEYSYQTGAYYRITMSKTDAPSYQSKQFELTPIIFASYDVRLKRNESAALEVSFAGVSIDMTPDAYYNNMTNNFSLTIASPLGQLQLINFTIVRSNNATIIQNSSTNAYGATITAAVPISNATIGDNVRVYYSYTRSDGTIYSFDKLYSIDVSDSSGTRFNTIGANRFGLPLFDRILILFIITALIAGVGFALGGLPTAYFLSILTLAYFGSVAFVTWWIILPSIVILCILGIWSLK